MDEAPLLDQINSQALTRLAAERGLTPAVTPAGEEAVTVRGRGWKRWLPYLFFALSVFALGGMVFGISALAADGWSWNDAIQLLLIALLVFTVFTQVRSLVRQSGWWRGFSARRNGEAATTPAQPRTAGFVLDAVSAEYLATVSPASATAMRRRAALKQAGSRWFDRFSVIVVIVLAVLAFLGMVFILGWIVYAAGFEDPAFWLTAPFTALTGFGLWQLFGSARKMSFRGRPFALISRAFRDSVRVWGSGTTVSHIALTTTATASVVGAAVVPALVQRNTLYDIFVIDSASAAVYRIDLATDVSSGAERKQEAARPVALATTTTAFTTAEHKKVPKDSLLVVLEPIGGRGQIVVGYRPNSTTPINIARIEPAIPGAEFSGGPGVLYAVQPDGSYWQVDLRTGIATRVGKLTVTPGPFTYEANSKSLVMVSGSEVVRLEPASGAVLTRNPSQTPGGAKVCGISDGPEDRLFLTFEGRSDIVMLRGNHAPATLTPTGEVAVSPCELAVALRKQGNNTQIADP